MEEAEKALLAARARCEQIEKTGAGDFPGLSVEARRAINLAAIACAEVLCLRLSKTNLVAAARTRPRFLAARLRTFLPGPAGL